MVYQRAKVVCAAAYRFAQKVPDAELRDQMKRAATSAVLNIAEGRGRESDADFARFLVIARGSTTELIAQIDLASTFGMIADEGADAVIAELGELTGMLSALIARLRLTARGGGSRPK
ncbi:MAG: four helix bundle protein [Planctomycetes bacterium]|nr:four helix bundle protein [Planctomycetota bacterium]